MKGLLKMKLFRPDPNLPGLQLLFDVEALADRIQTWMCVTGEFKVSIADIRYKPATSCLVKYVVQTNDNVTYLHAKAFSKNDWLIRRQKFLDDRDNHWLDNELAIVVIRFPTDAKIPGIGRLANNPEDFLAKISPTRCATERFKNFTTLAYKPNRRFTARMQFESGNDVVIKIHEPATFERILATVRSLDKLPAEIPSRIGQSRRHAALAYRWIEGETLDFALASTDRIEPLLRGIVAYLQRIQDAAQGRKLDLEITNPASGIDEIAESLSRLYPPLTMAVHRIRHEILLHHQSNFQPTLVHGDFHESQVVVSKHGICAIDFDNSCLSDPTFDLANLIAHLHYRACLHQVAPDRVGLINDLAIQNYGARNDAEQINRFRWNQIGALFRLATHPFRSGLEDWIETTEKLVEHLMQQITSAQHQMSAQQFFTNSGPTGNQPIQSGHPQKSPAEQGLPAAISTDAKFEFLADAFDLKKTERVIRRQLPSLAELVGNFQVSNIVLRRHKPGRRCLIEFELATDQGPYSVLGKASSKRLDRKSYRTQTELFDHHRFGYDNSDGVAIPRPLGYYAQWNMCFQEKVCATAGARFLEQNRLWSVTERIAVALAKLHSSDYRPPRRHSLVDELSILDDRLTKMMTVIPQESRRIGRILENCFDIGYSIDEQISAPIHRDFYHDQIMFSDEQTFLVDLDLVSVGHPALDVGNFLGHLSEHGVRQFDNARHWQQEETEVINRYLLRMPCFSNSDIQIFKVISFARHIFISWRIKSRRRLVSKIIETADRMTAELAANSCCGRRSKQF